MTTESHIKNLRKVFKLSSQKFINTDPNIKDTSTRLFNLTYTDGTKFRLIAFTNQLEIEVAISSSIHFSINLPDRICFANIEFQIKGLQNKIFIHQRESKDKIKHCMSLIQDEIRQLNLNEEEAIFIYRNGIFLVINPNRQIVSELKILSKIKIVIEANFPETPIEINENNIPFELKELIPLLNVWAISDDFEREDKVKSSSKAELQKIQNLVNPKMDYINSYLDSFKDSPLTYEATLIGNIAELVSELRFNKHKN